MCENASNLCRPKVPAADPSVNIYTPTGDRVECVVAQRLIKGVTDIQATDVAVARPTHVVGMNLMR